MRGVKCFLISAFVTGLTYVSLIPYAIASHGRWDGDLLCGETINCASWGYVTNYGSNTVTIFRTWDREISYTVPVGAGPYGVAVGPDYDRAFVANYLDNTVSVIEEATVVATIPVATRPYGVAVSPNGKRVYVTAYYSNVVSVIDTETNAVIATIPVGQRPRGVVVGNDNKYVYVANYASNSVSVIDVASNTVKGTINLPAGSNPMGLVLRPDASQLYVTGYSSNKLYHIDTATNTVVKSTSVGNRPWGVAISVDQQTAYVANYNANTTVATSVSVVNLPANTVISIPLPLGAAPIGVSTRPEDGTVFVVSYSDSKVYVIDSHSNTLISNFNVGTRPYGFGAFTGRYPVWMWDFTPPDFSNLMPNEEIFPLGSQPQISAEYSNPATGIDINSVVLKLDGNDVTQQAQVTESGVTYTPSVLNEGWHDVELSVADRFGLPNRDIWWFAVTSGPQITNKSPLNGTVFSPGPLPAISASYIDGAYVDPNTVRLVLDGQDVTAQSQITYNDITFQPTRLSAGPHIVLLSVSNPIGMNATASWSFTTTSGIQITPTSPLSGQHITDPRASVSASFTDSVSSIELGRTELLIDGVDVSALAQVVGNGVNFVPRMDWTVGQHTASLTLHDAQGTSKTETWAFSFDPAPTIYDETPRDLYVAVPNPTINAFLRDNGTGINVAATTISLDGANVTAQATVTPTQIKLPTAGLAPGVHTVAVHAVSNTGQAADKQWKFTVIALPPPTSNADGVRTGRTLNPTLPVGQ